MRSLLEVSGKTADIMNDRDEMTPRRAAMVQKIFTMMDRDGSGQLTVADILDIYDVSTNQDFIERRKTKEQILTEFLSNFEGGNKDGKVTLQEFIDYYTDVSMSVPNDEYFVRMLESVWQCPENDHDESAQAAIQMLLREARLRILELARGDPKLIKKVFSDFDLNQSATLTIDEVTNMIAKLKISVESKYVHPFFKVIDRSNHGAIPYEDFEAYVLSK